MLRLGHSLILLATSIVPSSGAETVIMSRDCHAQSYTPAFGSALLMCRVVGAGNAGRSLTLVEDGDRALIKDVVKRTGAKLLERAVTGPSVAAWAAKIERCEQQVQATLLVSLL